MSIVDESVPYFDAFAYAVYAVNNGRRGASIKADKMYVGPTCDWKIIMQSNSFQGWRGGGVVMYSVTGNEISMLTLNSSTPQSLDFPVPVGRVSFGWKAPRANVSNLSLVIKDAEGNTMYAYTGSSADMEEGIFLEVNNGCGNAPMLPPYNVSAEAGDEAVTLHWEVAGDDPEFGYNIYRDEQLYAMVNNPSERSFVDHDFVNGHCYFVMSVGQGGESEPSNETCASAGDCMAAYNLDYEYVGSLYKIKLKWDRPEASEGLSGYYLYRKDGEDGTYQRIKLLGASATNYTDNSANQEGMYYYRLYAYYREIDCMSAPATTKNDPNKYYLKVYYSPTDVAEREAVAINVFPNPADQSLKIEAEGMTQVSVYNMLGQQVYASACESNVLSVNVSGWSEGVYLMKVQTAEGIVSRRVTIVH
jgi:hypothetical protein